MAFNIKQFGDAVTMAITNNLSLTIPPGWHYDVNLDTYKKVDGNNVESISAVAVRQYGGIPQALAAAHMANQIGVGVKPAKGDLRWNNGGYQEQYDGHNWNRVAPTGPVGSPTGGLSYPGNAIGAIGANGAAGPYSMASGFQPAATVTMDGKLGKVTINLDTGELTMPPNVGRDAAIRDFWLGFQEHFQPTQKAKYEKEIAGLKHDIESYKALVVTADLNAFTEARKKVAEKVAKKYAGEKFIMIKPEDLVKFIQDA